MANPLRRLKILPWRSLLQVSALTTLIVVVLEFLLTLGYLQSAVINRTLSFIYAGSLSLLITFVTAIGVGTLAVYLLERFYRQIIINSASLWALVLCLALFFILKSLIPLMPILISLDQLELIGIILGVFWKGRPYWR
jgi:hypothetical protein